MPTINYYLTQICIPNVLKTEKNRKFAIESIFPYPQNLEYFLTKDMVELTCKNCKIEKVPEVKVRFLSDLDSTPYSIIFAEFHKEFVTQNLDTAMVAFAIKDDEIRYFTFEKDESITNIDENGNVEKGEAYYVCETDLNSGDHKNYGNCKGYNINVFHDTICNLLKEQD